jgi:hypothetical protein
MARSGPKLTRESRQVKTEDEKKEKCEHGEHCGEEKSEEISEDELLQHLKEGGRSHTACRTVK